MICFRENTNILPHCKLNFFGGYKFSRRQLPRALDCLICSYGTESSSPEPQFGVRRSRVVTFTAMVQTPARAEI